MLAYVKGVVVAREMNRVIVETAGGMGLSVAVPASTGGRLPEPGRPVKLHTHLIVREDSWQLAGFLTVEERDVFLALLQVNGVGVKVALAVLGHLPPDRLRTAVQNGEWKILTEVSGVGPKLAQRLSVELRGVLAEGPAELPAAAGRGAAPADEVVEGLLALGYTLSEAQWATADLGEGSPTERLRRALRRMGAGKGAPHADRTAAPD
jgi:Holliday junction DNA helicase RuvA